jgi:GNAT superfamily N-acetyltransferase
VLEIRPVRPEEVARAHAIEVACYPPAEQASLARFAARQAAFPDGFLGLFEAGAMRALLSAVRSSVADLGDEEIKAETGHDPSGRDLVILSVATEAAHRRRGLGGLLLAAIALEAERLRCARLRLLCKDERIALYARHGYRHVRRSSSTHGGAAWHEMERAPGLRDLRG